MCASGPLPPAVLQRGVDADTLHSRLTAVTAFSTALAPGSGPARHSFNVLMVVMSGSCSMPAMAMAAELVPAAEGGRGMCDGRWTGTLVAHPHQCCIRAPAANSLSFVYEIYQPPASICT